MPANRPSREELATWRGFLEAHHVVVTALEEELQQASGLSLGWYDVMVQLHEASGEGLRMVDLARRVLISRSGLTRLVDRMEDARLVRRRPSEEDARGFYVSLTEAGFRAFRNATPTHLRSVAAHFTSLLSDHELAVIRVAMTKVMSQRSVTAIQSNGLTK